MMFVVQKYLQDRKEQIEAWEADRDKWVKEGDGWRNKRDYEENHPRPGSKFKFIAQIVFVVIWAAIILFGIICFINHIVQNSHHTAPSKAVSALVKNGEECGSFHKGDKVVIQYGDYAEAIGTIIGGCGDEEDYQVKLDDKQMGQIKGDGIEGKVDVSNKLITVDSKNNMVVIDNAEKV